jgi:hypothetical protein
VRSTNHKTPHSTTLCLLFPCRPRYSPQHPILRHPQPMFHPQHYRPRFTSIQKTGKFARYIHFVDSKLEYKEIMTRTRATSLEHGGRNDGKGFISTVPRHEY